MVTYLNITVPLPIPMHTFGANYMVIHLNITVPLPIPYEYI